jgi:hypothetical protein
MAINQANSLDPSDKSLKLYRAGKRPESSRRTAVALAREPKLPFCFVAMRLAKVSQMTGLSALPDVRLLRDSHLKYILLHKDIRGTRYGALSPEAIT